MKKVFYKRLLAERKEFSASERIIYSFLLYTSISECEDAWDKEWGTFDVISLNDLDYLQIPLFLLNEKSEVSCTNLSKVVNISKATTSRAIKGLYDKKILVKDTIINEELYDEGYFDLSKVKLSSELLIFYSLLLNISGDKKMIYAKREKLAKLYHVKPEYIREYLHRLKDLDLVERGEHNVLILK